MEALASVAAGYGGAAPTEVIAFPMFGIQASLARNPGSIRVHTRVDRARLLLSRVFDGGTSRAGESRRD